MQVLGRGEVEYLAGLADADAMRKNPQFAEKSAVSRSMLASLAARLAQLEEH